VANDLLGYLLNESIVDLLGRRFLGCWRRRSRRGLLRLSSAGAARARFFCIEYGSIPSNVSAN
jgi:hypothetical protein